MVATVRIAMRVCTQVSAIALPNSRALRPTTNVVMSAATRIAVPVASGGKSHTAAYGVLYSVMNTALSSPGHGTLTSPIVKTLARVQTITTTDTMIHGYQPCAPLILLSRTSLMRSTLMANFGSGAGFQNFRNDTVTISETSDESTSVRL